MPPKKKKFNKVKLVKKLSRKTKIPGKGGVHKNKKDKANKEYITEQEE